MPDSPKCVERAPQELCVHARILLSRTKAGQALTGLPEPLSRQFDVPPGENHRQRVQAKQKSTERDRVAVLARLVDDREIVVFAADGGSPLFQVRALRFRRLID